MNAKTTPTLDELRATADAAQKAFADAQAQAVREAQAAAWDGITPVLEAVQAAVANRDAHATATTTQALSTFVKAAFGTRRTPTANGGTHTEGSLADLVTEFLTANPGGHTPGEIAKALGRSSGAVAAAIQRPVTGLQARAIVTETNAKPRRYALA